MDGSFKIVLIANALALMVGSASGKSGRQGAPAQILFVRLSDQAPVPAEVLRWATEEASRCFRSAKIQIAWERVSAESPQDQGIDYTNLAFPRRDERRYILIRLVRHTPADLFPGALGYALPFARTGAHVTIFYDRVEALTRVGNTAIYMILGDAMAHEIGHVLLGSFQQHATAGLMQARWDAATLRLASAGLLAFWPKEAAVMRAGVARLQARRPMPQATQPVLASDMPERFPQ